MRPTGGRAEQSSRRGSIIMSTDQQTEHEVLRISKTKLGVTRVLVVSCEHKKCSLIDLLSPIGIKVFLTIVYATI